MKYLTYLPGRNRPWTEHACFPKKAIEQQGMHWRRSERIKVYRLSDDRQTVTFVPEEEWEL